MVEERPKIPAELRRQVLMEAGHRCAIPVCGQTPVEIHHIRPWAQVQEHTFDNLIALCPTDHARAGRGEIDRKSLRLYKQNLSLIQGRYGESERRLLDLFVRHDPSGADGHIFQSERNMDFDFMYLVEDGLLKKAPCGLKCAS